MPITPTHSSSRINPERLTPRASNAVNDSGITRRSTPFITPELRPNIIDRITTGPALPLENILSPEIDGDRPETFEWCFTDGSEGSEGSEGKESKEGKDGSEGKESSDPDDLGIRSRVVGLRGRNGPLM